MMIDGSLFLSLTARDARACVEAVLATGIAQTGPRGTTDRLPDQAEWAYVEDKCDPEEWQQTWSTRMEAFRVIWGHSEPKQRSWGGVGYDRAGWLSLRPTEAPYVRVNNDRYRFTPRSVLETLSTVPFTVAQGGVPGKDWWRDKNQKLCRSFSDGHGMHGWMAAFSGDDGHARIASRRWLEHGPWRLLRDETHDVSLVQLYDLHADEQTAWEQYLPAQETLGLSARGPYISRHTKFRHIAPSFYDRAARTSIVLLNDREPTFDELYDAGAIKWLQPYEDTQVDQVAFVFMQEELARRWLPELWLRGLECRAMIDGRERVLSDEYEHPPHEPPDWVRRVQDREGE